MKQSMLKNGLLLGGFALVSTLAVALVNDFTKPKIAAQAAAQLQKTLAQIIPPNLHDNVLNQDCVLLTDQALGTQQAMPAYIAMQAQTPTAIAIETIAPDGYSGDIRLIVGISASGEVLGTRTLSHQETPGLGDKIEIAKDDWVLSFNGLFLDTEYDQRWQVKKDGGEFDQFTGATITPRAYVNAVRNTVHYFNQNKAEIFALPRQCGQAAIGSTNE